MGRGTAGFRNVITMAKTKPRKVKKGNNKALVAANTGQTRQFGNGITQQRQFRKPPKMPIGVRPRMTEMGMAFLKCAFAAPDFAVDPGKGIPDQFQGRTLAIKDCFTTALNFTPGVDTYILVAPVPGYAYFIAESSTVGSAAPPVFTGVPFPTFETNFGTGADFDNKFSKFRYASAAAGLYPTSNFMQFAGSIQSWKIDLNLAENLATALTTTTTNAQFLQKRVQGMQGITPLVPRDNYSESFIKGAYTYAFDKTTNFEWEDFVSSTYYQETGTDATTRQMRYDGQHRLTGLGNINTIVYKVSTPTGAVNSALFRVWNCIELQPDTNSGLFQFSGVSPPHDPVAMELYHSMKLRFPVAIPCSENTKFWASVLRMIQSLSGAGVMLPGPAGVISGGVHTIANAIGGLAL